MATYTVNRTGSPLEFIFPLILQADLFPAFVTMDDNRFPRL